MLFNSLPFIFLFLPISFFVYTFLNQYQLSRFSVLWLMFCSLFFYAWWNINYLPLLLASILINFMMGRLIFNAPNAVRRKGMLMIGVIFNIVLLAYFKYLGFFLANVNMLLVNNLKAFQSLIPMGSSLLILGPIIYKLGIKGRYRLLTFSLGLLMATVLFVCYSRAEWFLGDAQWLLDKKLDASHIILPIGISFFTFTQIAFLVDVYQRKASEYRLLHYTLFVSYFPHLLAGPIIHHAEIMPQFASIKEKRLDYKNIFQGLILFTLGLFKKVVLADTFAVWANSGYSSVDQLGFLQAWSTMLAYTFQLYFDFSGYTDMAIGMSWLFNIQLPVNFNSPYKAINIQEFWRRWHITLSRFLRNYLYIFLGGNRVSESKMLRNFLIVFLVGGIWHGAGWTFIIWGFLHGLAMSICKLWQKTTIVLPKLIAWLITFAFVNVAWVFFRANHLHDALTLLKKCVNFSTVSMINPLIMLALMAGFFICLFTKNTNEIVDSKIMEWKMTPVLAGGLFLLSVYVLIVRNSSAFLYFQF